MMLNRTKLMALALIAFTLGGCGSSPPPRYHALTVAAPPPMSGGARMLVEILPVAMPERLNREEMVLIDGTGQLDVRDGDRWAAPLADEVRQMVSDALWSHLWASDIYQAPIPAAGANGLPQYRLALRIERFEATLARGAVIQGTWTVRKLPQGHAAACRAGITIVRPGTTAGDAAAALTDGTAQLSRQIADSIARLDQGNATPCPADQ